MLAGAMLSAVVGVAVVALFVEYMAEHCGRDDTKRTEMKRGAETVEKRGWLPAIRRPEVVGRKFSSSGQAAAEVVVDRSYRRLQLKGMQLQLVGGDDVRLDE